MSQRSPNRSDGWRIGWRQGSMVDGGQGRILGEGFGGHGSPGPLKRRQKGKGKKREEKKGKEMEKEEWKEGYKREQDS